MALSKIAEMLSDKKQVVKHGHCICGINLNLHLTDNTVKRFLPNASIIPTHILVWSEEGPRSLCANHFPEFGIETKAMRIGDKAIAELKCPICLDDLAKTKILIPAPCGRFGHYQCSGCIEKGKGVGWSMDQCCICRGTNSTAPKLNLLRPLPKLNRHQSQNPNEPKRRKIMPKPVFLGRFVSQATQTLMALNQTASIPTAGLGRASREKADEPMSVTVQRENFVRLGLKDKTVTATVPVVMGEPSPFTPVNAYAGATKFYYNCGFVVVDSGIEDLFLIEVDSTGQSKLIYYDRAKVWDELKTGKGFHTGDIPSDEAFIHGLLYFVDDENWSVIEFSRCYIPVLHDKDKRHHASTQVVKNETGIVDDLRGIGLPTNGDIWVYVCASTWDDAAMESTLPDRSMCMSTVVRTCGANFRSSTQEVRFPGFGQVDNKPAGKTRFVVLSRTKLRAKK